MIARHHWPDRTDRECIHTCQVSPDRIDSLTFAQLKASGVTILLVEQNIRFAQRLGDTVAVMDNGRVVHAGSMQALADDPALQRTLLGLAL